MRLSFDEDARAELDNARHYYASVNSDLGIRFLTDVRHGLRCISEAPAAWPPYSDTTRRYLLHNFPYHLVYLVEQGAIVIIAVAHNKRDPSYWVHRLGKEQR